MKLGLAHHGVDVSDPTEAALTGPLSAEVWKINTVGITHEYRFDLTPAVDENTDLPPYCSRDRGKMTSELWSDDSVVGHPALVEALEGTLLIGFEA